MTTFIFTKINILFIKFKITAFNNMFAQLYTVRVDIVENTCIWPHHFTDRGGLAHKALKSPPFFLRWLYQDRKVSGHVYLVYLAPRSYVWVWGHWDPSCIGASTEPLFIHFFNWILYTTTCAFFFRLFISDSTSQNGFNLT